MKSGKSVKSLIGTIILTIALSVGVFGQFNSGSTGADGALDLSNRSCTRCWVSLPESGILNYTTVNVPASKWLLFKPNSRNTPVTLLVQGDVNIAGIVDVSAPNYWTNRGVIPVSDVPYTFTYQTPGPGGFLGGDSGRDGSGPGKGTIDPRSNPRWSGPLNLSPIVGGSGAAGVSGWTQNGPGGGGGGAILIAASGTANVSGSVYAVGAGYFSSSDSNSGSGGAIRIVAQAIAVSGGFAAYDGLQRGIATPCALSSGALCGVVRLETPNLTFSSTAGSIPPFVSAPINPDVTSGSSIQLNISSVGGYSVPSYAGSDHRYIDLLLPNQLTDPISVGVRAVNVPVGSQVELSIPYGSSSATSTKCTLAGTLASSSCTGTISNLNRGAATYLMATVSFSTPGSLAAVNPTGNDQVSRIKMESPLGGAPRFVFMRKDGSVIDKEKVPRGVLQAFGM